MRICFFVTFQWSIAVQCIHREILAVSVPVSPCSVFWHRRHSEQHTSAQLQHCQTTSQIQTDRQTDWQRDWPTDRDWLTDRQTDREMDRRQTDRSSSSHDHVAQAQGATGTCYNVTNIACVVSVKKFWRTGKCSSQCRMMRRLALLWRSLVDRSMPGRLRLEIDCRTTCHRDD